MHRYTNSNVYMFNCKIIESLQMYNKIWNLSIVAHIILRLKSCDSIQIQRARTTL